MFKMNLKNIEWVVKAELCDLSYEGREYCDIIRFLRCIYFVLLFAQNFLVYSCLLGLRFQVHYRFSNELEI